MRHNIGHSIRYIYTELGRKRTTINSSPNNSNFCSMNTDQFEENVIRKFKKMCFSFQDQVTLLIAIIWLIDKDKHIM